ncbi:MAG: hypothetical protein ACKOWN_01780 [Microbacteriaceae bacterium]
MNTATATSIRAIHLLDIENLLGTPFFTARDVTLFKRFYETTEVYEDGDLIVIATSNSKGIFEANVGWGSARYTFRHGENGADFALIDVLKDENIDTRFGRVVIASGDGIFENQVKNLLSANVDVHVVSRRGSLHHCIAATKAHLHLFCTADYDLAA